MKKSLAVSVLTVAVITGATLGVSRVSAAQTTQAPVQSLIDALAQKFGLKSNDVKSVFENERTKRQQERSAQLTARLDEAVKDGKITEAQKKLILQKHSEMQKEHEARCGEREAKRAELEKWAQDNDIDSSYFMMGMRGGRGGR